MKRALIFDCDGVMADTEPLGHRLAFNRMWREFGIAWQWDVEEYGRKLQIAGGKERLLALFHDPAFLNVFTPPEGENERRALIDEWHRRKTAIYRQIVTSGEIPPRPGVRRLAAEALEAGWTLAVASTSQPESVNAVLSYVMGPDLADRFALVLAGDVVKRKKPAPDIYLLAAERLDVEPSHCVVIEDSEIGATAASDAGMNVVVTVSTYTVNEDFSRAGLVLSCLGEPDGEECRVLESRSAARPERVFGAADLAAIVPAMTMR